MALKYFCDICGAECAAGVHRLRNIVAGLPCSIAVDWGSLEKQPGMVQVFPMFRYASTPAHPMPDWAVSAWPDLCDPCANKLMALLKTGD
jgi:hypothetical protein